MRSIYPALVLTLAIAPSAPALQLIAEYGGTITGVPGTLTNTFSVGDSFFGTYVFESTTPPDPGNPAGFAGYNAVVSGEIEIDTQLLAEPIILEYEPSSPDPLGQGIQIDDATVFGGDPPEDRYGYVNRVSEGLSPFTRPASGAGGSISADVASIGFAVFGGGDVNVLTDTSLPTDLAFEDFQRSIFLMLWDVTVDPDFANGNDTITEGVLGTLDFLDFFLPEPEPGDTNVDGEVNTLDIDPFVLAISDLPAYEAMFPGIDALAAADINIDGVISTLDIDPFVDLIVNAGSAAPEPAAGLLLSLGLAARGRGSRRVRRR